MHNEFDGDVWKSKIVKTVAKEIPVDVVKCFLQIKFEGYIALLPLRFLHEMDDFLQNNRVICSAPTRQETALIGANNVSKNRPKPVNKNLCYNFVGNVTETDGPEIFVCSGGSIFGISAMRVLEISGSK